MSRFNQQSTGTQTTNMAGGVAYTESAELELVSLLLTSFATDQFYRGANQQFDRLKQLLAKCDPEFAAKAAVYARTKFGMRSITHVLASELAKYASGKNWTRKFYNAVVYRPDDMTEIVAYHLANNGRLSEAMKRGFADAFEKFDSYSLAKYRKADKNVKLVDVVNLVRPTPVDKNAEALKLLVANELRSTDTWEAMLTKAGQEAESEEEKAEFKKEAWINLITNKKIKYFALLRNLRNIIEQAPEVLVQALEILVDKEQIKRSLVLPFRFVTAYDEMLKMSGHEARLAMVALSVAIDHSLSNVPKFDGNTLVVLDVSGSMSGNPSKIGSLFSSILIKSNNADFIVFSDSAKYVNVNPLDSTLTIANSIRFASGGTNFHSIFQVANRKYERIVILSDMQGWIGNYSPAQAFNSYKNLHKADPFVYSFDLNSYGTLQFPERNVFCLAGFSDKVFDIISLLEQDKNALVNEVKKIQW